MGNIVRRFTVNIPTKTYLKKFLHRFYGDPIPLTYHNQIGIFILPLMERQNFTVNMVQSDINSRMSFINDTIICKSALRNMGYKGHSINPDKIIAINRYFENLFAEKLYIHCLKKTTPGQRNPGYDKAIIDFTTVCSIDIDIDISMDALKQTEYRQRKEEEKILTSFVIPAGKYSTSTTAPHLSLIHI